MSKFSCGIILAIIASLFVADVKPLVNGTEAEKGLAPYMAAITFHGKKPFCSGAILNNQYVLSSAHMLYTFSPKSFEVYFGQSLDEDEFKSDVSDIRIHPGYEKLKRHHDIALVRLAAKIESFSEFIRPIILPTADFPDVYGEQLFVSGFGGDHAENPMIDYILEDTVENGLIPEHLMDYLEMLPNHFMQTKSSEDVLKYFSPVSMTLAACIEKFKGDKEHLIEDLNASIICAENPADKALCEYDQGNPLVKDGQLIGIAVAGCYCDPIYPGVYTKVHSYISWIRSELQMAGN